MGWASCFEDIWDRRDEAANASTTHIIGPAGTPPPSLPVIGPAGTPPPSLPVALVASYDRLRSHCNHIASNLIERYEKGQWQQLSDEMDSLQTEIARFDRTTVLASESQLMDHSSALSSRIASVLDRAKAIIYYLNYVMRDVYSELETIRSLRQQTHNVTLSPRNSELEKRADTLVHGWRALKSQAQHLDDKATDLHIDLSGDVFVRLMANPKSPIPDKDAEPD